MSDFDDKLDAVDAAVRKVRARIEGAVDAEAGLAETHRHKPERGRVTAQGRNTDDGSSTTLLAVHEVDGAWTIHYGVGGPGVTLSRIDALWVAESILERAHLHGEGDVTRG